MPQEQTVLAGIKVKSSLFYNAETIATPIKNFKNTGDIVVVLPD